MTIPRHDLAAQVAALGAESLLPPPTKLTYEMRQFLDLIMLWKGIASPGNIGPQTRQAQNSARQRCKRLGLVTFESGYWRITDDGRAALKANITKPIS